MVLADLYGTGYVPVHVETAEGRSTLRKELRCLLLHAGVGTGFGVCFRLIGLELHYRLGGGKARFADLLFSFAVVQGSLIEVGYDIFRLVR